MKRVRLGDKVRVISGKYKGVDGAVIAVNHKDNTVTVENACHCVRERRVFKKKLAPHKLNGGKL